MLRFVAALTILVAFAAAGFAAPPGASAEVRAIWVTRWDFRTEKDVRTIIANCASVGLNRVYFQVRGRADAFYRSPREPWAEELGGRDPGFDPLATAVRCAHEAGLELHAWINVLAGWKGKKPPGDPGHLIHTHPEWFLLDRNGTRYLYDDHYTMLNPCRAEVRRHLANVALDIVTYPVDGLHLDYIRFVFPDKKRRRDVPYDNDTLHVFRGETGGFPSRYPEKWNRFRERGVNTVVWEISQAVRRARPKCRLSAAVVRDLDRGRELYFQNSRAWLERGWVDEVLPMNYDLNHTSFQRNTQKDMERASRKVVPGLGAHLYRGTHDLEQQVAISRRIGAPGYALFAYASFWPTPSHASVSGRRAAALRRELRTALRRLNGR